MNNKIVTCVIAGMTFFFATFHAGADQFDAVYVFGDSTVDSGWWKGALNGQCDGAPSPCTTGSATKNTAIASALANGGTSAPVGVGSMNTQILASYFGLTANPANQPGGTNYAISGALSAPFNNAGNLNPNGTLPSTVGQITNYLGGHANLADPSALYIISSGGNDVTNALNLFPNNPAQRQTYLTNQAIALAAQIAVLQSAGAQHVVVYGTQGSGFGSMFFTSQLFSALNNLNIKFIGADIAGLIASVEANPTAYGFTAATVMQGIPGPTTGSACVSTGTGWGQWCANTIIPNGVYATLRALNSEQTSFFSDDQHLSAAGQLIEANYVFSLIETPLPAALPLFATGLGVLGLLGWRRKKKPAALAA
jgi:outer membrane lipase/esterase